MTDGFAYPTGHEGLWLAAGFSGHGFMMAPAVGRRVAEALAGAARDPLLRHFSFERLNRHDLVHEQQVV